MSRKPYPSDLTNAEWRLLEPLIPPPEPNEYPRIVNMREIVNAMFYVMRTGSPWENVPHDVPSYLIVYLYFRRWQKQGLWNQLNDRLQEQVPAAAGRAPEASAGMIVPDSVKAAKPLNIKLLEDSFALVKPRAAKFASSFYINLFTDYPHLSLLFANINMEEQENKLMMSLVLVINNLRNLAYLTTILKDLGERHVRYSTRPEHYPMVGAALLKTFESYLGTNWTPEVKQAWTDAYGAIVDLMLKGEEEKR